jgi:U4/U6.U5 tri-snRNP-associated protein 3
MGFKSFNSSKNKNHSNTSVEGVKKNSTVRRVYRQYMNRRGGFNRKLDQV